MRKQSLMQLGRACTARLLLGSLLFLLALLGALEPALADSPIEVLDQSLELRFPDWMRFRVTASSAADITAARLTLWQNGSAAGTRLTPSLTPGKKVELSVTWSLMGRGQGGYLPPGTRGSYTWHLEDAAGRQFDTPKQDFFLEDTTHEWMQLKDDTLVVKWYKGDAEFGRAIYERAKSAFAFLTEQLGVSQVQLLQIYIYAGRRDFFRALEPTAADWTGGRTFPDQGIILINFDEDNLDWGLGATSHELSHAILHAKLASTLAKFSIPHWMDEGLAVYNESPAHEPVEQFQETFNRALKNNQLLPLRSITQRFPSDPELANLAYGQSYSVVRFMIEKLGVDKFGQALRRFQGGAAYEDVFLDVYGLSQDELENLWRQDVGAPPRAVQPMATRRPGPVPTYELSGPLVATPTFRQAQVASEAGPGELNPAPVPESSLPQTGLCGGVFGLMGVALWSWRRGRRGARE